MSEQKKHPPRLFVDTNWSHKTTTLKGTFWKKYCYDGQLHPGQAEYCAVSELEEARAEAFNDGEKCRCQPPVTPEPTGEGKPRCHHTRLASDTSPCPECPATTPAVQSSEVPERDYALEERELKKWFVPQFPKGFLPTMGELLAFQAGRDSLSSHLTEARAEVESWKNTHRLDTVTIRSLEEERGRLRGALEKIATAECPNYMAHPQSVWWEAHVKPIARAALAASPEDGGKKE